MDNCKLCDTLEKQQRIRELKAKKLKNKKGSEIKKTGIRIISFLFFTILISCDKHLDEKIFKSKDITVKWYRKSDITSGHDFIDLERWGYTENILKANIGGIYDVKISGDTIIIRALPEIGIYDLVAKKYECYIKLDTAITKYQYMKKYQPENAIHYINE